MLILKIRTIRVSVLQWTDLHFRGHSFSLVQKIKDISPGLPTLASLDGLPIIFQPSGILCKIVYLQSFFWSLGSLLASDSQRLRSSDKPIHLIQLLCKTEERANCQGDSSTFGSDVGFAFTEFRFHCFQDCTYFHLDLIFENQVHTNETA